MSDESRSLEAAAAQEGLGSFLHLYCQGCQVRLDGPVGHVCSPAFSDCIDEAEEDAYWAAQWAEVDWDAEAALSEDQD